MGLGQLNMWLSFLCGPNFFVHLRGNHYPTMSFNVVL